MIWSRRQILSMAAALPLVGGTSTRVWAEHDLGGGMVQTLSDGSLTLPGDFLYAPMPQKQLAPILAEFDVPRDRLIAPCNVTLYRDATNIVLFDVGAGPDFMPSAGSLTDALEAIDLGPEDVTHVVFTHAHPDHLWGLLDDFDDPVFPQAQYLMGRTEWDYWWNPETVTNIGEDRAAFAVGAKRRMERIEDAVTLIDDGQEILPGIAAVSTPGHTPGHMSFELRPGQQSAMVLGDAIGNPHVAFRQPDWIGGSDQDGAQAAQTRLRLLDRLTAENMLIAGFHLPGDGMGRAERRGASYQFVAEGV